MERLTESNPTWIDDEFWVAAKEPDDETIDTVYRKLKAYEDAEEQGLLVKLPCKVGDTAFVLETENETGGKFRLFEGAIVALQFTNEQIIVSIGDTGRDCWFSEADRQLSDIGHEWFLTREEAEAALRKCKGGGEDA